MTDFSYYADLGQSSLDYYFKNEDKKQQVNNVYPLTEESQNDTFNYWWVAHLVDVRIDAYLRTGNNDYLKMAEETYQNNKTRNKGSLIHEFYDDMLWNALAALRLYDTTKGKNYLVDAKEVCLDIFETGWNEEVGGGFAWRREMPYYKNTPVNAPIIILALRLYQIEKEKIYFDKSVETLNWLESNLVDPKTRFVEDGINRNQDGKIDTWSFTYNQGVYMGALIEFYKVTGNESFLKKALQCATTSLERLVKKGVFSEIGDGGDLGLFKGIEYRYLHQLYDLTKADFIKDFIENSCEVLIRNGIKDNHLLAYRDWTCQKISLPVYLSDEISGVMALESAVF